jgi:oxygen-dependent protoporphyrinogen oxidase
MSSRVIVVGAGPCGLAVAFRLRQRGHAVTVLEANARPGGNVGTLTADGFRVELGPNGFLDGKPGTLQLCRDLGLADRLIAASEGSRTNRYVYHAGRIEKLPGSVADFLRSPLLSPSGKLSLVAEPLRHRPTGDRDESVAAFARRRFGREAADVFVAALVTGIHAGDPGRLSVRAAFPRLAGFERGHGSVVRGMLAAGRAKKRANGGTRPPPQRMWSFREGLQVLVDALARELGDALICGEPVTRLDPGWRVNGRPADAVVLTAPAFAQAEMLSALDPLLSAELAAVEYAPVAVVAIGYRTADVPHEPDGFGYIAPGHLRRDVLGVQWCSRIFPDRAPPGFVLWRALCGGAFRPDLVSLTDDELVRRVHAEQVHAMGVTGPPAFARVVRWPRAIPQLTVGHPARLARIAGLVARHPGLHLLGNWSAGVALNDVTEQAGGLVI